MRFEGTLKSWNDDRGFGFIEPDQGGQTIFIHILAFPSGTGRPIPGVRLTFEVETGSAGKKRAKSVQFGRARQGAKQVTRHAASERPAAWTVPKLAIGPIFIGIYAWVSWRWSTSPVLAFAYLAMSVLTFMAYAIDKSAAIAGRRRLPERALHVLGFGGGWPGGLLAQQMLRHKSAKADFQSDFWATVILNIGAFVAWNLPIFRGGPL